MDCQGTVFPSPRVKLEQFNPNTGTLNDRDNICDLCTPLSHNNQTTRETRQRTGVQATEPSKPEIIEIPR